MHVTIGSKATNSMPTGLLWPAIAVSEETSEKVTIIDKSTGKPVDIIVTRADFISLRQTREGDTYLALTNEVVNYGYRMVAMPRLNNVIGLDVDADGTLRTPEQNLEEHAKTYSTWQAGNFASRKGGVDVADL